MGQSLTKQKNGVEIAENDRKPEANQAKHRIYTVCSQCSIKWWCGKISGSSLFMNRRPLALGAFSGSLTSLALRWISDSFEVPIPANLQDTCNCDLLAVTPDLGIDSRSFIAGLICGVLLIPVLEFVVLVRTWWRLFIQRQLANLHKKGHHLYRVLS